MCDDFVLVDLDREQKAVVLGKASHYIYDDETKDDLNNNRKKWIRFRRSTISEVAGELSYYCNRSKSTYETMFLDELISNLEFYE